MGERYSCSDSAGVLKKLKQIQELPAASHGMKYCPSLCQEICLSRGEGRQNASSEYQVVRTVRGSPRVSHAMLCLTKSLLG